ncbi:MAG: hypothetical protein ACRDH7_17315 [Actinomycetota bacterium]
MSSSANADAGLFWALVVLLGAGFGFLGGSMWKRKGGSPGVGFAWGFLLGLIGLLILSLFTPNGQGRTSPASRPPTWMKSGHRYLLGFFFDPPMYAIWDRQAPGPPVVRYPYSEHGKGEALARFQALEPDSVEVAVVPVLPPPPGADAHGS